MKRQNQGKSLAMGMGYTLIIKNSLAVPRPSVTMAQILLRRHDHGFFTRQAKGAVNRLEGFDPIHFIHHASNFNF